MSLIETYEQIYKEGLCGFVPRQHQDTAIREVLEQIEAGKRNIVMSAPVGSGKSLIGMVAAEVVQTAAMRSYYVTSQKNLQTQIVDDFGKHPSLFSMVGKANYSCTVFNSAPDKPHDAVSSPCRGDNLIGGHIRFSPINNVKLRKVFRPTDYPDMDEDALIKSIGVRSDLLSGDFSHFESDFSKARINRLEGGEAEGHDVAAVCSRSGNCPYYKARDKAEYSPITLMNTATLVAWNTFAREAPYFKPREFHIFDECHLIEDNFREAFSEEFNDTSLGKFYNHVLHGEWGAGDAVSKLSVLPEKLDSVAASYKFLTAIRQFNNRALEMFKSEYAVAAIEALAEFADGDNEDSKNLSKVMKIDYMLTVIREDIRSKRKRMAMYILPSTKFGKSTSLFVKPMMLPPQVSNFYGAHNLFMSGTIPDKKYFCRMLQLDPEETAFINVPDTFSSKRRPIFVAGVGNFSHRSILELGQKELGKGPAVDYQVAIEKGEDVLYRRAAESINDILQIFDHKGIVHVGSYRGASLIGEKCVNDRLRICTPETKKEMLAEHMDSGESTVLVSPSMKEGLDFKDGLCRIQILAKLPFPNLKDPFIEQMNASDKMWCRIRTAMAIQQQNGRGMRGTKDWVVTIILDEAIAAFILRNRSMFSAGFIDSLAYDRDGWRTWPVPID